MPKKTLFVILGAGASYDAASSYAKNEGIRPPLVHQLFDARFDGILNNYPMAKNAAPEIRDAIGTPGKPGAVSLEDHLRTQYRDSGDDLDLRRYYSIVLYLQDALLRVSNDPGLHFDNLDRLINALLRRFDHVCFVTLNYDLLLDRCLSAFEPLASLHDFIRNPRWSLIKLHGSVTWGRHIRDSTGMNVNNPPAGLRAHLGADIFHSWGLDLDTVRTGHDHTGSFPMFPALSAPLGKDDELTCPPDHIQFLEQRLADADELDLLVIGYSAYDTAVIQKLDDADKEIRSLMIVNANRDTAAEVGMRLAPRFGLDLNRSGVAVADERFGDWVRGGMVGYLERHPAHA